MKERKPFWKPAVGVLEEIGKSFLFLVFMYYSTQAVLKYWEEPAVTNIQYTFGDNEKGIQFPLITFCDYPYDFIDKEISRFPHILAGKTSTLTLASVPILPASYQIEIPVPRVLRSQLSVCCVAKPVYTQLSRCSDALVRGSLPQAFSCINAFSE